MARQEDQSFHSFERKYRARYEPGQNADDIYGIATWGHSLEERPSFRRDDGPSRGHQRYQRPWYEDLDMSHYAEGVSGTFSRFPSSGNIRPAASQPRRSLRDAGERYRGRKPKGYRRSDESIYEDICRRLTHHPDLDPSDVQVTVKEGEVIFSGTVAHRGIKRLITDEVEGISGVTDVNNQLRVSTSSH